MTKTSYGIRNVVAVALLVAGILTIPFYSAPADAKKPEFGGKKEPGVGLVGVVEKVTTTQGTLCDASLPASSSKGGLSFRFIVPSTISTVLNNNDPNKGVNVHIAFVGSDGKYFEAGMYYGDFTAAAGSGYDKTKFQFAYGASNPGKIKGVSTIPVVAGHDMRISIFYFNSQGHWAVIFEDITTGTIDQQVATTDDPNVASDLLMFMETNTAGANTNSDALGLVTVKELKKGTKIEGDGVSVSNFADGFVTKNCAWPQVTNYGVTYLGSV
ncbi:MAG TPA: hypothetical protein VNI77_10925, partial [Nitrososphaera sp.]|nr:hypothetical protein [Nitrososphaera sp.]